MSRPRSIPEDEVLDRALHLFWERGYDRSSINDLSAAVGLGPSSLYNAFGSKEELFRRALARYMQTHGAFADSILAGDPGQETGEGVRELLRGAVRLYTTEGLPPGCAMFQGAGAGAPEESEASLVTQVLKRGLEASIRRYLERRARAGDDLAASPAILARFLVATLRGLSQLATDGVGRRPLLEVANHAARSCVSVRR